MNTMYTYGSWISLVILTLFGVMLVRSWYHRRIEEVGPMPKIDPRQRQRIGTPPRPETNDEYAARCPDEWRAHVERCESWEREVSGIRRASRQLGFVLLIVVVLITLMILDVTRKESVSEQDVRVAIGERVTPLEKGALKHESNIMELASSVYALRDQVNQNSDALKSLQSTGVMVRATDNPQGQRIRLGDDERDVVLFSSITNILKAQESRMEILTETLLRDTDRRITSAIDPINRQIAAVNARLVDQARARSSSGMEGGPREYWVTNSYSALARNHWPNKAKTVTVTVVARYQHPLTKDDALVGVGQLTEEIHEALGRKFYATENTPEAQKRFQKEARTVTHRWFQTASKAFRDHITETRTRFDNETSQGEGKEEETEGKE